MSTKEGREALQTLGTIEEEQGLDGTNKGVCAQLQMFARRLDQPPASDQTHAQVRSCSW